MGLLDTEGGVWESPDSYSELLWRDRNLLRKLRPACMWGGFLASNMIEEGYFDPAQVTVTGCARFDFYHPRWRAILDPGAGGDGPGRRPASPRQHEFLDRESPFHDPRAEHRIPAPRIRLELRGDPEDRGRRRRVHQGDDRDRRTAGAQDYPAAEDRAAAPSLREPRALPHGARAVPERDHQRLGAGPAADQRGHGRDPAELHDRDRGGRGGRSDVLAAVASGAVPHADGGGGQLPGDARTTLSAPAWTACCPARTALRGSSRPPSTA